MVSTNSHCETSKVFFYYKDSYSSCCLERNSLHFERQGWQDCSFFSSYLFTLTRLPSRHGCVFVSRNNFSKILVYSLALVTLTTLKLHLGETLSINNHASACLVETVQVNILQNCPEMSHIYPREARWWQSLE